MDEFTVESARFAARRGDLDQWVASFLRSPGSDNAVLADALADATACWCGPVRLPFDDLHRLAGPPDQPALAPLGDDDLETVEEMRDSLDEGWDAPPLIVSYRNDLLSVEDGNHRIEGLRRRGFDEYWCVVAFDDEGQREAFLAARGATR